MVSAFCPCLDFAHDVLQPRSVSQISFPSSSLLLIGEGVYHSKRNHNRTQRSKEGHDKHGVVHSSLGILILNLPQMADARALLRQLLVHFFTLID